MYKDTCTACGDVHYHNDILKSMQLCKTCGALAFGLKTRVWVKGDICPRCKETFHKEYFKVCVNCLNEYIHKNQQRVSNKS